MSIEKCSKEFIAERLRAHLSSLPAPRDPYLNAGKHTLTQQYLRTELAKYAEVTQQTFSVRSRTHTNWQIAFSGTKPSLAPILVGAHYDTVPNSPGADDNASGLAALLTLAELLHSSPPRRSIHLVAFDLEEYGLHGSLTCAKQWKASEKPLHLMLSLEMLGYFTNEPDSQRYPLDWLSRIYPSQGNFLALVGNLAAVPRMNRLAKSLGRANAACRWLPVINQGKQIPAVRRSDHAPFWDEGYSAILVTDTAELRSPHYHSPTDTLETLNIEKISAIALGLFNYLKNA